ncbi:MAG: glutamate racemase [Anaerolineales bacterium]|nr:glutamate racemase [Anaerolineales bacterium]
MVTIGVFDSGVGGLSVLRHVRAQLPAADLLYLADTAHVPYGPRSLAEVRGFSAAITRFLRARGADVIVVACNTASAAALKPLRAAFPDVPFVGMEPAVKPAAEQTRSGVVGVLATPATFQGELFNSVVERFAQGVRVIPQVCPGLVEQIEAGALNTPATEQMLRGWVEPLLAQGIDALVLGCTHYPFVIPLLERIAGPAVRVIDPAPAVARQTARIVAERPAGPDRLCELEAGRVAYFTSGAPDAFARALAQLGGAPGDIQAVGWERGQVLARA